MFACRTKSASLSFGLEIKFSKSLLPHYIVTVLRYTITTSDSECQNKARTARHCYCSSPGPNSCLTSHIKRKIRTHKRGATNHSQLNISTQWLKTTRAKVASSARIATYSDWSRARNRPAWYRFCSLPNIRIKVSGWWQGCLFVSGLVNLLVVVDSMLSDQPRLPKPPEMLSLGLPNGGLIKHSAKCNWPNFWPSIVTMELWHQLSGLGNLAILESFYNKTATSTTERKIDSSSTSDFARDGCCVHVWSLVKCRRLCRDHKET